MGFVGSSTLSIVGSTRVKTTFNIPVGVTTELSQVLPSPCFGYFIAIRERTGELKITHVSGESGTKYQTVPTGTSWVDDNRFDSTTLYFQSTITGVTVEIVAWA